MLVDSHCHLDLLIENGDNIDCFIDEAKNNSVNILNTICTSVDELQKIVFLCEKYDCVFGSFGIHPSEIGENIVTVEEIIEYTKHKKICSIGETGLDYHFEPYNKAKQIKNFEVHIEASRKTKLPLIIHSRDCDSDMIDILTSEIKNGEFPFLLHSFCSGKDLLYRTLDYNAYISLSGIVTFKNSRELQELTKDIPLDKIMVETDSPFLAPVPKRGNKNQPAFVKYTAEFLSKLLNIEFEKFCDLTTNNFLKLFNKINFNPTPLF